MSIKLYHGDALQVLRTLPSESVHCCITSPPYWGLRDYGVDGQIGLEPSFDEFIATLVELFREVKRVLRKDGTCWVNMGDSFNGHQTRGTFGNQSRHGYVDHGYARARALKLHPKNLVGQPWRVAFALQEDGWILRSDIVWHKPSAMPESVDDRPTRAHEFIFLFAQSQLYYYDASAVAERAVAERAVAERRKYAPEDSNNRNKQSFNESRPIGVEMRNKRSVWTIPSEAFPEAHFATFPTKLVEPCLLAGTSERGCCTSCGAPWCRQSEKQRVKIDNGNRKRADAPGAVLSESSLLRTGEMWRYETVGWQSSCKCEAGDPIPCTVLDPFSGSGTTGMVAARLMRSYIGIELNQEYLEMSRRRIYEDRPLFNNVEVIA